MEDRKEGKRQEARGRRRLIGREESREGAMLAGVMRKDLHNENNV